MGSKLHVAAPKRCDGQAPGHKPNGEIGGSRGLDLNVYLKRMACRLYSFGRVFFSTRWKGLWERMVRGRVDLQHAQRTFYVEGHVPTVGRASGQAVWGLAARCCITRGTRWPPQVSHAARTLARVRQSCAPNGGTGAASNGVTC